MSAPTGGRSRKRSQEMLARARSLMPGGVNSPVRAFKAVGGDPLFVSRGHGSRIVDADGNEYIDYVCSWGPLILGHAPDVVIAALERTARDGTSFGAPTPLEADLADLIVRAFPSIEKIRMVNSGTEATLSALRLARAATGRDLIVKLEGCYHGHVDALLVKAGSGIATLGIPGSPGVPESVAACTLTAAYNDIDGLEAIFRERGKEIACVIVEPVAGNMGVIPPAAGYLEALRDLTRRHASLLIFDEVMTGFRVSPGGAQTLYGVLPDLTTLGKIIGGGLPVGAYGGPADLMDRVAPEGPVYQAGTLSGNPLAMAAGAATLRSLRAPGTYERLERSSDRLETGMRRAARDLGVDLTINRVGSMMSPFFTAEPVVDFAGACRADAGRYSRFFHGMLERGVNLAPSAYEALFVSIAHTEEDLDLTIEAARGALDDNSRTSSEKRDATN